MSSESRKIAYYCMACPEVFYDAETSNAHHDATGHNQHWEESRSFAARQRPASPRAPDWTCRCGKALDNADVAMGGLCPACDTGGARTASRPPTTPAPRCDVGPGLNEVDEYMAPDDPPADAVRSRPAAPRMEPCTSCGSLSATLRDGECRDAEACEKRRALRQSGVFARPAAPHGGEPGVSATDEGETKNGQPQVQERRDATWCALARSCIEAYAQHGDACPYRRDPRTTCICGLHDVVRELAASDSPSGASVLAVDRPRSSTKAVAVAEENVFRGAPETAPLTAGRCTVPPPGWYCTRAPGHEGPCAARLFSLGQAWVSGVTNESGDDLSVIGADVSPRPEPETLDARDLRTLQAHYEVLADDGLDDDVFGALVRKVERIVAGCPADAPGGETPDEQFATEADFQGFSRETAIGLAVKAINETIVQRREIARLVNGGANG